MMRGLFGPSSRRNPGKPPPRFSHRGADAGAWNQTDIDGGLRLPPVPLDRGVFVGGFVTRHIFAPASRSTHQGVAGLQRMKPAEVPVHGP